MKLEVGQFARTEKGEIFKINNYNEQKDNPLWMTINSKLYMKGTVIKASHNILDLIKAKDVLLIKDKQYDDIYKAEVVLGQDDNLSIINYDCDKLLNLQLELYKGDLIELVSVLTCESFENNCYKIGDE